MSAQPGRICDRARFIRRARVVDGAARVGALDQRLHIDRAEANQTAELHVREDAAAFEADDGANRRSQTRGHLVAVQQRPPLSDVS